MSDDEYQPTSMPVRRGTVVSRTAQSDALEQKLGSVAPTSSGKGKRTRYGVVPRGSTNTQRMTSSLASANQQEQMVNLARVSLEMSNNYSSLQRLMEGVESEREALRDAIAEQIRVTSEYKEVCLSVFFVH